MRELATIYRHLTDIADTLEGDAEPARTVRTCWAITGIVAACRGISRDLRDPQDDLQDEIETLLALRGTIAAKTARPQN